MFFTITYVQFIEIETNTSLKYLRVKLIMHMVLWIIVINNQSGEA